MVHNITNYVVMNTTANALLAIGASPVMAHAIEEVEEVATHADALVINLGTLSAPWVKAMFAAGRVARRRRIPVVLDPVGCGASRFRTSIARRLVEKCSPTVVRGNASEIRALCGREASPPRGVESQATPDEAMDDARVLSDSAGCVVSVSGPIDLIVGGSAAVRVANGHPMMARVTGMGCTASALTGAFVAVNRQGLEAAAHAMSVLGIAGELAAEHSAGPGSFQVHLLDALDALQKSDLVQRARVEMTTRGTDVTGVGG